MSIDIFYLFSFDQIYQSLPSFKQFYCLSKDPDFGFNGVVYDSFFFVLYNTHIHKIYLILCAF